MHKTLTFTVCTFTMCKKKRRNRTCCRLLKFITLEDFFDH